MNSERKIQIKTLLEIIHDFEERKKHLLVNYSGTELHNKLEEFYNQRWVQIEGLVAILEKKLGNCVGERVKYCTRLDHQIIRWLLALLGAKELSDELMETLRKSQEDKKTGRVRPYEEIAEEAGLREQKRETEP